MLNHYSSILVEGGGGEGRGCKIAIKCLASDQYHYIAPRGTEEGQIEQCSAVLPTPTIGTLLMMAPRKWEHNRFAPWW